MSIPSGILPNFSNSGSNSASKLQSNFFFQILFHSKDEQASQPNLFGKERKFSSQLPE